MPPSGGSHGQLVKATEGKRERESESSASVLFVGRQPTITALLHLAADTMASGESERKRQGKELNPNANL